MIIKCQMSEMSSWQCSYYYMCAMHTYIMWFFGLTRFICLYASGGFISGRKPQGIYVNAFGEHITRKTNYIVSFFLLWHGHINE